MPAAVSDPAAPAKSAQITRVIAHATDLAGDQGRAIFWFKHQPLSGFGKTAEELVEEGHAELVIEDLERMREAVYS